MNGENPKEWLYYLGLVTQLGLVVVVTILVGLVAGVFLDKLFQTSPVLSVVFIALGVAAGLYNAYQLIMRKK